MEQHLGNGHTLSVVIPWLVHGTHFTAGAEASASSTTVPHAALAVPAARWIPVTRTGMTVVEFGLGATPRQRAHPLSRHPVACPRDPFHRRRRGIGKQRDRAARRIGGPGRTMDPGDAHRDDGCGVWSWSNASATGTPSQSSSRGLSTGPISPPAPSRRQAARPRRTPHWRSRPHDGSR